MYSPPTTNLEINNELDVIAETERLYLRRMTTDDVDFLQGLFSNLEVMKYYGFVRDRDLKPKRAWKSPIAVIAKFVGASWVSA
jgi:hypothetical protein